MDMRQKAGGDITVRLLTDNEKYRTRPLYEEAFPEDGPEVTDCYYKVKMSSNRVFAAVNGAGHVSGMLCLNPYRVMVRGTEYPLNYIVAVATEKARRREGIMRSVLTEALLFQRKQSEELRARGLPGIPFTYLKPANPAYYTPFGFAYISRRERRNPGEKTFRKFRVETPDLAAASAAGEALPSVWGEIADFMNEFLGRRYEVRCRRDERYLRDLAEELASGDGELLLYRGENGEIAGTAAFDEPGLPPEAARLLLPEEYLEAPEKAPEPFMMGRIVDLEEFLKAAAGKQGREGSRGRDESFRFVFADPLIPANSGVWSLDISAGGDVSVTRQQEPKGEDAHLPVFTPEELAPLLLGYRGPGEGCGNLEAALSERALCELIPPVRGVYFDEEM